jgi:hypothetical protein
LLPAALVGEAFSDLLKHGGRPADAGRHLGGFVDSAGRFVDIDPKRDGGVLQQKSERLELPEQRQELLPRSEVALDSSDIDRSGHDLGSLPGQVQNGAREGFVAKTKLRVVLALGAVHRERKLPDPRAQDGDRLSEDGESLGREGDVNQVVLHCGGQVWEGLKLL